MSIAGRFLNRRRKYALIGAGTALCMLAAPTGMFFGSTTIAHANNMGDVWLDNVGQPSGPGHEMDPHLACANINLWGAKMADPSGTYTIDGWPPSGSQEQDYPASGDAHWSYDQSKGGSQVMDVIDVGKLIATAIANGDAPINKQGFHFKLQFSQDPQKHKVFWVNCPTSTPQHPQPSNCYPTKSVDPAGTVNTGTPLKYEVRIANNSSTAGPCSLDDVLSLVDGASYAIVTQPSATRGTITGANPTWNWSIASLAPGDAVFIRMIINPLTAGKIINTATIPSPECTPTAEVPCSAQKITPVISPQPQAPNCFPLKSVQPDNSVLTGTDLLYTVMVSNNSATDEPCVVDDVISLAGGANYAVKTAPSVTDGTVTGSNPNWKWSISLLKSGQSAKLTMTITATAAGTITNTASVSSNYCTPTAAKPCSSPVSTLVIAPTQPNCFPVKKVEPTTSVSPGDSLKYTVTASNNSSVAADCVVDDVLSLTGGATYSVVSAPSSLTGTVTGTNPHWTWNVGTLLPNGTAQLTMVITATATGTITNTASVPSANCTPTAAVPCSSTVSTPVVPKSTPASFTVNKSVTPAGSVPVNTPLHYVVTVTNNGGSAATPSGSLADNLTLSGGATYSMQGAATADKGTVGGSVGNWTWDLTSVSFQPGDAHHFDVTVIALTTGTLTNTAILPNSNCPVANMPAPCTVTSPVNLVITKTVSKSSAQVGDTVTYMVTVMNPTSNDATNVIVDDLMGGTAGFLVDDGTGGTQNSFSGDLGAVIQKLGDGHYSWAYATLPANRSATVSFTALIRSPGTTTSNLNGVATLTNTASTPGLPPVTVTTTVPISGPPSGVQGISTAVPNTGGFSRMNTTIAGFLLLGGIGLILIGAMSRQRRQETL